MPRHSGATVFRTKKLESAVSRSSVREDWSAHLPAEKKCLFDRVVRHWEDAYAIFSVALDDAFSLRSDAKLVRGRQCVELAAGSVGSLTEPLAAACRALARGGRHLPSPPAVAPLNPTFYRGDSACQRAQWNQLMHHVLFGGRSRFLHKLRMLELMVLNLADDFRRVADDLSSASHPDLSWQLLDEIHYDMNTSLRETIVVLKSFLVALPEAALSSFQTELNASLLAARQIPQRSTASLVLGRRAGHFRRE